MKLPRSTANGNERIDAHNGILLSPTCDALLDKTLITFENNGKIILSDSIEANLKPSLFFTGGWPQWFHYYFLTKSFFIVTNT